MKNPNGYGSVTKLSGNRRKPFWVRKTVGWNEKGYILQNSWGLYWADNGRAILPFDYPIDSAWAISTDDNNVYTYTTIWQKIYTLILKIINKFLK